MPDEVARIGALSNGSNGQRSLESASLHFEAIWRRERRNAERSRQPKSSAVEGKCQHVFIACVTIGAIGT